jgi:hypothetical protein
MNHKAASSSDCNHPDKRILILTDDKDYPNDKRLYWCMECEGYVYSYITSDQHRTYYTQFAFDSTANQIDYTHPKSPPVAMMKSWWEIPEDRGRKLVQRSKRSRFFDW